MKILITSEWYTPVVNGVVTSVLNLERGLSALGHEVKVLTLSSTYKSHIDENTYFMGSYKVERIYPRARVAVNLRNELVDELIAWKPDVIHSQQEFSTFLIAKRIAKNTGAPIVQTYHTVYEDYAHYFLPNPKLGRAVVSAFTRKILSDVQTVIAPTAKVKDLLEGYGVYKDIYVVPTGLDLSKFDFTIESKRKEEMLNQIGVPKGNKVAIYIGRLAKEKNLEEIIQFVKESNHNDVTLVIVGDGPHREELEAYTRGIHAVEKTIFVGMVDPSEVPEYYQIGDVFLSASKSESQGLTYIEALASGVPALCREDRCLDGVIENGLNGWQYDGYEDFSTRFDVVMTDDNFRTTLSQKAKESVMTKFSTETFGKNAEKVYYQTVERFELQPEIV